jgi:hypothetical protein
MERRVMTDERQTEERRARFQRDPVEREVRADDPQLSPEANRLLTEELREAVGTDRVELPADRAESAGQHVEGTGHRRLTSVLAGNRMLLAITFLALIIVGVIVSLATGSWWAVVAAAAVHALGTLLVASITLRASTQVEHVSPTTAAKLTDEGVADPDGALSDLVEQYAPTDHPHGAAEVVSSGENNVTVRPDEDAARASAEQRSAITPAGSPVGPAGDRGAPALLPIIAVAGSVIVGVAAAIAVGGWLAWLAAALLVGASLGWLGLVLYMDGRDDDAGPHRAAGDAQAGRRTRLLPVIALVVPAVAAGVILVGVIGGFLR